MPGRRLSIHEQAQGSPKRWASGTILHLILALLCLGVGFGVFQLGMGRFSAYAEQERRGSIKEKISLARHALEPLLAEVRAGSIDRATAIEKARAMVRGFTYEDDSGTNYLFMNGMDGTVLVRPQRPQDEGTRNFLIQSEHGTVGLSWDFLRELRANPQGLYTSYLWPNPNTGLIDEKVSFIAVVPELNVMIGTGSHRNNAAMAQFRLLRQGFWVFTGLMLLLAVPFMLMLRSARRQNLHLATEMQERKAALDALKLSELRFQTIFTESPFMMILQELESGCYVDVNRAYCRFTGYERADVIGKSAAEVAQFTSAEDIQRMRQRLIEEGTLLGEEIRYPTRSGEKGLARLSCRVIEASEVRYVLTVLEDITAQKKAEAVLAEQEERLRLVIEATGAGFFDCDLASQTWLYSARWAEIVGGYCPEELPPGPRSWLGLVHPEDLARAESEARAHLEGRTPRYDCEYRLRHKAGHWVWVHARGLVVARDPEGGPLRFIGSMIDVTARRTTQEALEASQATFGAVFRLSQAAMALTTWPEAVLMDVNEAWADLTGIAREEAIGRTHEELGLFVDLEDRAGIGAALSAEERVHDRELVLRRRDGRMRTILWSARLFRLGGIQCRVTSSVDITGIRVVTEALRESERRLRSLFEDSPIGIFRSTPEGRFIQVNPALAAIFRYEGPEDMIETVNRLGIPQTLYEHPEQRADLLHILTERPGTWRVAEVHFRRKDDSFMDGIMSITLGQDPEVGRPLLFGFVQDISERKQAEEALREIEAFRKRVFESSRTPMVVLDPVTHAIIDCNPAATEIFGFSSREETLGKSPLDVSASVQYNGAPTAQMVDFYIDKALTGESVVFEWRQQRPDGECWDAEVHLLSFRSGEKQLLQFSIVDITERKRAEEALRSKTALLEAQMNATLDGILVIAGNLKRNFINPRIIDLFNVPPSILEDEDDTSLLNHVVGLAKYPARFLEKVLHLYAHPSETSRDEIEFKSGMVLERYTAPVLGEHGKSYGRIWTFRDITERKRVEEALRENRQFLSDIVENSGALIYVKDPEGYYQLVNRCWEEVTGLDREVVLGKTDAMLFPEPDALRFRDVDLEVMESGAVLVREEELAAGKDPIFFLSIKFPLRDLAGQVTGICGMSTVITERKLAEEALRESDERVRRQRATISGLVLDEAVAAGDFATALERITQALSACLKVARVSVWRFSEDGSRLRCLSLFDAAQGKHSEGGELDAARFPRYVEALQMESRIAAEDAQTDPRTRELTEDYLAPRGISSLLEAGVLTEGRLAGMVSLEHIGPPRRWHPDEEAFAGTVAAMVAQILATAERKRAEEALVLEHSQMLSIFESLDEAFYVADPKTCEILFANRVIKELCGKEVIGGLCYREFHGLDAPCSFCTNETILKRFPEPYRWEFHNPRLGKTLDIHDRIIRWPDGRDVRLELAIDISERRKAEEEIKALKNYLASVIDSMPSVLVGLDREGCVTQWNRAAEDLLGAPASDALGRPFEALAQGFAPWVTALRQESQREHRPASMEKLLLEREGERRFYELMLYPLVAEGLEGTVVRIQDVTERVHIQELMIQSEKMLSVGGLAAGMAHEINNPLGIISQAAQNIQRRLSAELPANRAAAQEVGLDLGLLQAYFEKRQITQFMSGILEAVARATRIVTSTLQFSRQAGSVRHPAFLTKLMEQALDLAAKDYDLKKRYDFRSIEIRREFEPGLPSVPVVAIEIEQVLLNLFKNAAQAMAANPPERRPCLALRVRRDARHVVMEIEDNGPGMAEAIRRRVFEPFFTTKEPGLGTGLGLSVSYTIITQNHKGLMEVASTPGRGALFTVRLPMMKEHLDA